MMCMLAFWKGHWRWTPWSELFSGVACLLSYVFLVSTSFKNICCIVLHKQRGFCLSRHLRQVSYWYIPGIFVTCLKHTLLHALFISATVKTWTPCSREADESHRRYSTRTSAFVKCWALAQMKDRKRPRKAKRSKKQKIS